MFHVTTYSIHLTKIFQWNTLKLWFLAKKNLVKIIVIFHLVLNVLKASINRIWNDDFRKSWDHVSIVSLYKKKGDQKKKKKKKKKRPYKKPTKWILPTSAFLHYSLLDNNL